MTQHSPMTTPTCTVFDVAEVLPATSPLPEVAYKAGVESLLSAPPNPFRRRQQPEAIQLGGGIESCSRYHGRLISGVNYHPVVAAIHLAFTDHRPLVLSPDMIWLLVAQGFANHVNANAEELRSSFVQHTGRVKLIVRRDDFVKGTPENPWSEVFGAFSSQIREHLGEPTHDLLLPNFSTTGPVERAAAEVVLLNAMQSYFTYVLRTRCGIPRITLEGTSEDWLKLADRAVDLGRFGLSWWTGVLAPILNEFAEASQGQVNSSFWKSIYKQTGGSGGPFVSGWINAFFPYLKNWNTGLASEPNPWLNEGGPELQKLLYLTDSVEQHDLSESSFAQDFGIGPTTDQFPSGLAKAPFIWEYFSQQFNMDFLGGFVGVQQDADTLCLCPEIGWAVREQPAT